MPVGLDRLWGEDACCRDQTGSLETLAELLEPLEVRWLVLADGAGKPLAAWSTQPPFSASEAERLAAEGARRLEGRAWCTFVRRGSPWMGFAMRITRQSADVLLAGQVRRIPRVGRRLHTHRRSLYVGGKLACTLVEMQSRNQRLRAHVRQLVAECETVRAAQAEAVAAALAACDRRLQHNLGPMRAEGDEGGWQPDVAKVARAADLAVLRDADVQTAQASPYAQDNQSCLPCA